MRGVIYVFCGLSCAERLVVSLYTLRKHWDGNVTLGVTTNEEEGVIRDAAKRLDVQVTRIEKAPARRNAHYLTKSLVPTWTPYDETLFIDADTIVTGPIEDLFGEKLTITQFAEWVSTGNKMSGRCREWKEISPYIDALVDRQVGQKHPAINTGVFCFRKGNEQLALWHTVAKAGQGRYMTDELAMQLLLPNLDCRVVDDRWNCSPMYGVHTDDVRIWHFHGKKHLREGRSRELWLPVYNEVVESKLGRIQRWGGTYDKHLRAHLADAARQSRT